MIERTEETLHDIQYQVLMLATRGISQSAQELLFWFMLKDSPTDKPSRELIDGLIESLRQETESFITLINKHILPDDDVNGVIIQSNDTINIKEKPPRPPKQGRKFAGHQGHVRGVIDVVLLDMLMQESVKYGDNVSRAITAIFWQHFDKPELSFEIPESELEALKLKYPSQDRGK